MATQVEAKQCGKCGFKWKSKIKKGKPTKPSCPNCTPGT